MRRRLMRTAVTAAVIATTLITNGPAARAAFPGANGRIVFEYGGSIVTSNPDGSNVVWLGDGVAPEYSPDGALIVFEYAGDIWTMSADGSDPQQLTTDPDLQEGGPHWAPDQARIAFSVVDPSTGYPDVWVMDADGSDRQRLTDRPGYDIAQEWSPDGTTLLYLSDEDQSWYGLLDVFAMDPDGSSERNLTRRSESFEADAVWSPDGTKIAYFSDLEGRDIWTMNPDGTGQTRIGPGEKIAWSPDGDWLVFGDGQLAAMRTDGSGLVYLGVQGFWPDWQPTSGGTDAYLAISKSLDTTLNEGQEARFSITVSNFGPGTATGVAVTDDLPAELGPLSASATVGDCVVADPVTCSIGSLDPGEQAVVTVVVLAEPGSGGTFTVNTATVTSDNDPGTDNNTVSLDIAIAPPPLEITGRVTAGSLNQTTGVLTVRGTTTCTGDVWIWGSGAVRQRNGRAYANGDFGIWTECADGAGTFTAEVANDPTRPWAAGKAAVIRLSVSACDGWTCDDHEASPATITIKASR